MIVRTIQRLLLDAQQNVPGCECVALVDLHSGLLFGMTDVSFDAELRELMAATAAHWLTKSPARTLDSAFSGDEPSQIQSFVSVGDHSAHIIVRSSAHPERAAVFVVRPHCPLHELCEHAKRAAAIFDNVF